jgi:hypothetical protein
MIFHHHRKKVEEDLPVLSINNVPVERVTQFNFLGIMLDVNANWKSHIDMISKKIARSIGIICKLKHYIPLFILKTLYNSLVLSKLNYGLLAWGFYRDQIFKLQKKVIRLIANAKYNAHTEPIFRKLELITIHDLFKLNILKFYFHYCKDEIPIYFKSFAFKTRSQIHSYNTRHRNQLHTIKTRTKMGEKCLRCIIPHTVNQTEEAILTKINTHSYQGFCSYFKICCVNSYQEECVIPDCYVCISSHS